MKKYAVVFLLLLAFGVGTFFVVSGGYYPVAIVEGVWISNHALSRNVYANTRYYQSVVASGEYGTSTLALAELDFGPATLTRLIEDVLVAREAEKVFGKDYPFLLKQKTDTYEHDAELKQAVNKVYGMSFADFREDVLIPQATRDLVDSQLFLRGKTIQEWLEDAKQVASVKIFSSYLYWDGEEVKVQK